jgi:fibronectin type 3 domain-containing protein
LKKVAGILFLLLFFAITGFAQDSLTVVLQANPGKESIKLRWIVNRPYQWQKSLKFGYVIERYTVKRNGILLDEREKKIITPAPVKAAPLNDWELIARKNNYAAVLAQALYGETFEVTGFDSTNVMSVINQTTEREQRFAFALLAADRCFDCACLAGWGYEDRDVKKGEYYLYRVIPEGEGTAEWDIQYGFAYTGIDDYRELPKPVYLDAQFGNRIVQLKWNVSFFQRTYCAWQLEKSEDNVNFEPVGLPASSWDESSPDLTLTDSIAENDKTYYYRVKGLTVFGDEGPFSDVVSGKGVEPLNVNPVIRQGFVNEAGNVEIKWEFDETAQLLLKSFELQRSNTAEGVYEAVVKSIPNDRRDLIYDGHLEPSNYFMIVANPVDGLPKKSFPILVMPVDSFPPSAPQKLSAVIDTTGRVSIKWLPNRDPDLLGYKIFRANVRGEEAVSLIEEPVPVAEFADSVDLNSLNTHVYYVVKALDKRYNQSEPSAILEVEKPLKVKPSSPVFNRFEVTTDGILLSWVKSPGPEVLKHTLYRSPAGSADYKPLKVFQQNEDPTYIDTRVEGGMTYSYMITAGSKWNVESDPSPGIQLTASPAGSGRIALKQLKAGVDREKRTVTLSWNSTSPEKVKEWKVYRAENKQQISLWQFLPGNIRSVIDDNILKAGDSYHYMIIATMKDGGNSRPEKISVNY